MCDRKNFKSVILLEIIRAHDNKQVKHGRRAMFCPSASMSIPTTTSTDSKGHVFSGK
jgi:hypothetical protein